MAETINQDSMNYLMETDSDIDAADNRLQFLRNKILEQSDTNKLRTIQPESDYDCKTQSFDVKQGEKDTNSQMRKTYNVSKPLNQFFSGQ